MVDYSKWDHIDVSDDDEDDVDVAATASPCVTRLDDGARVTIGPDGSSIIPHVSRKANCSSSGKIETSSSANCKNGWSCDLYSWSQDRYEVKVQSSALPLTTKASDVSLKVTEKSIQVTLQGMLLFGGELQHSIAIDDDDLSSGGIDWEVSTGEHGRFITFALRKKSPIPGSFIWWKRLFTSDPDIDTSVIEGRSGTIGASDAWEKAHELFRQRVASNGGQSIVIPTDIDDDAMGSPIPERDGDS